MSNIYRAPAIDASYQVSVHLAKRFQRRFLHFGDHFGFKMATIANQNGRNMVQYITIFAQ
jgi:hypothetical protein